MSFVVVIGGCGALGRALIRHFAPHYNTVSVDFGENETARHNVRCGPDAAETVAQIDGLSGNVLLVVNAAGGWAGGDAKDAALSDKTRSMWESNVESSVLAASLAARLLHPRGMVVFVGAKAVAMHPTPDMLAYAMAKTAVASLAGNLALGARAGLPEHASVVLLLPEVLDTEMNRKCMPDADTSKWTPPTVIAEKMDEWLRMGDERHSLNGTSWLICTRAGITSFTRP